MWMAASEISARQIEKGKKPESAEKEPKEQPKAWREWNPEDTDLASIIDSMPMLQNYAAESMGISFGVKCLVNGFVEYGLHEDGSDFQRVYCGGYRTTDLEDEVVQVRLHGLKPDTRYYYRIGIQPIHYGGGYDIKKIGKEYLYPRTFSFETAGTRGTGHCCVINDTHSNEETFNLLTQKLASLSPRCVVWNGDVCDTVEHVAQQKRIFLSPQIERTDYASSIPYLFCPGNHDLRGWANRHLERIWMYRDPSERDSKYWDLGRNFAVRMGNMALIGLDTGEDKLDSNPRMADTFCSESYREKQKEWLADVLKEPQIKKAPFLVVICHIPLFDPSPHTNPGDLYPADEGEGFSPNFALWQRQCAKLWGGLIQEAGCQVVICAHQHRYQYHAADQERSWDEFIGGGPNLEEKDGKHFPTIIECFEKDQKLVVRTHNLTTDEIIDEHFYARRKHTRLSPPNK